MKKTNEKKQYHPVVSLIDELIRVNSRLRTVFAGATEASGLSSMQLTVLTAVVEAQTPPTVPQIGRSLGHPRQVIQRAASLLLEAELIENADNPHHKRAPLLIATESGKKIKLKADKQALAAAEDFLKLIGADACETLTGELRDLRSKIETYTKTRKGKHGAKT
ncbi:MAG TPA: helix-turn-helix domain-containing protein [Dongiaceae bacterium]|nr:helix-turn-helix domain-containing protein [Dongiaceae bacterium]